MAISDTTNRIIYQGNNSTSTPYVIPFRFDDPSWIRVIQSDSMGNLTSFDLGVDYTLSGSEITTHYPLSVESRLVILRETPQTQPLDPGAYILPEDFEKALDRATMALQDKNSMALTFPADEPTSTPTTIPSKSSRSNTILGFGPDGKPVVRTNQQLLADLELDSIVADTIAAAATATENANASEHNATNAVGSETNAAASAAAAAASSLAAAQSANQASSAAANAAAQISTASSSADAAASSAAAAASSSSSAALAADAAATSESNALNHANSTAGDAMAAATSETNSANSAAAAAADVATIGTSLADAETAATNAEASANASAASATTAAIARDAASGHSFDANQHQNQAYEYKIEAENFKNTASTKATEASTSAATATTQAASASSSAASALASKNDAEAALAAIEMVNAAGHVGFFTLAALNADLAHPEGTLGEVVLDDVDPETNNAVYIKNGASGAGSWSKTNYSPIARIAALEDNAVLNVAGEVQDDTAFGGKLTAPGNDLSTGDEVVTRDLGDARFANISAPNLIRNGLGAFGDNTDFAGFDYTRSIRKEGSVGAFTRLYSGANFTQVGEFIKIDPNRHYELSAWVRGGDEAGAEHDANHRFFVGAAYYDADGLRVNAGNYRRHAGSAIATLTQDLNPGDTEMHLSTTAGWHDSTLSPRRGVAFYPYTDVSGREWDNYTRDVYGPDLWPRGGVGANTVTLSQPWAGPTVASGRTAVNPTSTDDTIFYIAASNEPVPTDWADYSGVFGGYNDFDDESASNIPPAATSMRLTLLGGYGGIASPSRLTFSNLSLREVEVVTSPDGSKRATLGIDNAGNLTANLI